MTTGNQRNGEDFEKLGETLQNGSSLHYMQDKKTVETKEASNQLQF